MKDALNAWASDPMEFVGMVFCCSILAMLALVLARGIVNEPNFPAAVLAFEWAVNIFGGCMLAVMIVGMVDGQTPGAARVLMPVYCLLAGGWFLWIAHGSLAANSEISAGRVGAVYLTLGGILLLANVQRALFSPSTLRWVATLFIEGSSSSRRVVHKAASDNQQTPEWR